MRRCIVLGICALLLVPGATAVLASGQLKLSGTIATPTATEAFVPLDALLFADTSDLGSLHLEAAFVAVRRLATQYADVDAGVRRVQFATGGEDVRYALTDVQIGVASGDLSGWLGMIGDGRSPLMLTTTSPLQAKVVDSPALANGGPSSSDEFSYFRAERTGAHVDVTAEGTIAYEGPLKLKVRGPDLRMVSRENTTTLRTGVEHHEGPAGESDFRWAVLESPHAILRIDRPIALETIAPSASLRWTGAAELGGARGQLETREGALVASGGTARVEGELELDVLPASDGAALVATLSGDLRDSSLVASTGARVPMRDVLPAWAAAAASFALLAAIVVALLLRRRRQPRLEADDCLEMAHLSLALDRLDDARMWIVRGRKLSPRSGRLMLEEGHVLERMGRHDAALRVYAEAERAMPTRGDADLAIARVLQVSGAAREEAEARLSRSLERSPLLLLEIEGDERLRDLLQAPQVRSAIRAAREALE